MSEYTLWQVLSEADAVVSMSETRRLIAQEVIRVNDELISNLHQNIKYPVQSTDIISVGKRCKIRLIDGQWTRQLND